ncbi:MAG: sugar ABC transporter substrate-binding protein [candidate division KSB1 bacterium]|nr:sugar ABC transporter substrate-binding protein [candidate division KSB1 bacterium]
MWAIGAEGERFGPLVEWFRRENPGVDLRVQTIPWSAAHEKLITAVAGGTQPDLCQLGNTWMPEFYAMQALAPLDSFIALSSVVKPERYFPGPWASGVFGGRVYGIPWYVETRVLFYRTDLLAQVGFPEGPRTWEELYEACRRLTVDADGDGRPDRYGLTLPVNVWEELLFFTWQAGGSILAKDLYTPAVTSEESKEAWRYYVRFFREGLVPVTSGLLTDLFQAFESGYYAMFFSGPWMVAQLKQNCPTLTGRWMVAPMPTFRTADSWAGGCNLVLFRKSKHKAEAWRVVEFLSRPEVQREWYRLTSDLPAVEDAWSDSTLTSDPFIQVFHTQLQHTRPAPQVPEWEQIAARINRWLEAAVYGKVTVDQALEALARDIHSIMRKRPARVQANTPILRLEGQEGR